MATTLPLTIEPSISPTKRRYETRILDANLGNGYSQRAADGINSIEIELNLRWVGTKADIDELQDHFEERAGYKSFTINDSRIAGDTSFKWTCRKWERGFLSDTHDAMTATFRKENDLI